MILACGVTKEEMDDPSWVSVDLLVDNGTTDFKSNIYHVSTWHTLFNTYGKNKFNYVFIDGGLYDKFANLKEKQTVMKYIRDLTIEGIIVYGTHMLLRGSIPNVCYIDDPLNRDNRLPFTFIPKDLYNIKNMKYVYDKINGNAFEKIRLNIDLYQRF